MPKYFVINALPKGQQPGALVELNDDEARVFLLIGAVREVADPPVAPAPSSHPEPKSPRRRYQRRDMTAALEG